MPRVEKTPDAGPTSLQDADLLDAAFKLLGSDEASAPLPGQRRGPKAKAKAGGAKAKAKGKAAPGKVPDEVPDSCLDRYNVLMKLPIQEVQEMLEQIDLPTRGGHRVLVVRLVRHLAELPPSPGDAPMLQWVKAAEEEKLLREKTEAMEATRKALEENRQKQKKPAAEEAPSPSGRGRGRGRGRGSAAAADDSVVDGPAEAVAVKEEKQPDAAEGAEAGGAVAAKKEQQEGPSPVKRPRIEEPAAAAEAVAAATAPAAADAEADAAATAAAAAAAAAEDALELELSRAAEEAWAKEAPQAADCDKAKEGIEALLQEVAVEENSEAEAEGEGHPGARIVAMEPGNVSMMIGESSRWLRHFEKVSGAELEISLSSKLEETRAERLGPPTRLHLTSPNGQQACVGVYVLEPNFRANEEPVWKKMDTDHWIYSGLNEAWFVGGMREKKKNFQCSTGYMLSKPHNGVMPHEVDCIWRRSDGRQWHEDSAITMNGCEEAGRPRPGLHVRIQGLPKRPLRRWNGHYGRIISRDKNPDTWRVRLSDGCEENFEATNLFQRDVTYGEAWLRAKGVLGGEAKAKLHSGEIQVQAMLSALNSLTVDLPADTRGLTVLDVPAKAVGLLRLVYVKMLMQEKPVIAALAFPPRPDAGTSKEGDDEAKSEPTGDAKLILYGEPGQRCAAALRAMVHIEKASPGHYSEDNLPQLSISGEQKDLEDFGVTIVRMNAAAQPKNVLDADRLFDRAAEITGAVSEQASSELSFVGGSAKQRDTAAALLKLLFEATKDKEIPRVPEVLTDICTRLRVPASAYDGVATILAAQEGKDEKVCTFWMRPSEESKKALGMQEEDLQPGKWVWAQFDEQWCPAKMVEANTLAGTASVEWEYDGSRAEVPISELRPSLDKEAKVKRHRFKLLATAWNLVLVGPARPRKSLALRVMASTEESCEGVWTSQLLEAVEELRGSSAEDSSVGVDARHVAPAAGADTSGEKEVVERKASASSSEPNTFRGAATKKGKEALERASVAADCVIQLVGSAGLMILGTWEERARGLDYFSWLLTDIADRKASASSAESLAAATQAVEYVDADGDRIAFRRRGACTTAVNGGGDGDQGEDSGDGLDFFLNGERRIRDIHALRADGPDGRTLHLTGTSCVSGSPTVCTEVPSIAEHEGTAQRILELFHECQRAAVWANRKKRGDVSWVRSTRGRNSWIENAALRAIEKESKTIILVGGISAREPGKWNPKASAEVHLCGHDNDARSRAAEKVRRLLDAISSDCEYVEGEEEPPNKKHKAGGQAGEAAAPALPPSDARAELRKLGYWPKDYPAWREVQDKIWKNHTKLAQGWFRVWSRSKDRAYYVRYPEYKATFDVTEAMLA